MSQNIKVVKCEKCGKVLSREVSGEMRDKRGMIAVNTRLFLIKGEHCPNCQSGEDHENR